MTQHRDLFAALAAPFDRDEVKTRPQGGRQLPYVTARTVMNRLDEVLGPENWWDEYQPLEHSVICKITLRLPDGSTITKCDAGGYAGMSDKGDDDKSGFADAFKRAAVKFGVGRYLYRDGVASFTRSMTAAAPEPEATPLTIVPEPAPQNPTKAPAASDRPKTGRDLYRWAKDHGRLPELNAIGTKRNFPARVVDWTPDQIAEAGRTMRGRTASTASRQPATVLA